MLKRAYDAVIFGGRLSGLLIAALLRHRNADVLILNDEDSSDRVINDYKLDLQMMPLGGIPDSPHVTEILAAIGVKLDNKGMFCPLSPLLQIIDHSHRLDLHGDRCLLVDELEREFIDEAHDIAKHLWEGEARREKAIDEIMSLKKVFPSNNTTAPLIKNIKGASIIPKETFNETLRQLKTISTLDRIKSLCSEFAMPLRPYSKKKSYLPIRLSSRTKYYPMGGVTGFKQLLLEKLQENGADVHQVSSMHGLTFKRNNVTGVNIEGGIGTRSLVFNSETPALSSLLPEKFFTRNYREQLKNIKNWGRWRSIFIAVDKDRIPVGMKEDMIIDKSPKPSFIIQMTPEQDKKSTREGMRLLKVSSPIANSELIEDKGSEDFATFEQDALSDLNELIPFLDKRLEVVYRHDSNPLSPDDCIFNGHLQSPLHLGTISPFTPYKNLFVAGKELMLPFGMEGDFISSKIIADYVLNAVSKN